MTKSDNTIPSDKDERRSAVIVAVQLPTQSDREVRASVDELRALLKGLNVDVVDTVVQKRSSRGTLGKGLLTSLSESIARTEEDDDDDAPNSDALADAFELPQGVDQVVFDGELSPGDARRMQGVLDVPVFDRTQVILNVFAVRAQTREAQLEIELAQLLYQAPRVRDTTSGHGRVGGGGRGGKGHTGVALTKQRLRERSALLRKQLDEVHSARSSRHARRAETFSAALVGYTNAGKSSLMRALTGSEVLVEDKLFATLGTTVRALHPPTQPRILISDTVGFIRNLPHALIASFRATLAEAHEADLLLYVVDASDPECDEQLRVTREVIGELDAAQIPSHLVLNKVDKIDEARRAELAEKYPDASFISAHVPQLIEALKKTIVERLDERLVHFSLALSYADLPRLSELRTEARLLREDYDDVGGTFIACCTEPAFGRLRQRFSEVRQIEQAAAAVSP